MCGHCFQFFQEWEQSDWQILQVRIAAAFGWTPETLDRLDLDRLKFWAAAAKEILEKRVNP